MKFVCTAPKCNRTYEVTSQGAKKVAKAKDVVIYHRCNYSRKELQLMRPEK